MSEITSQRTLMPKSARNNRFISFLLLAALPLISGALYLRTAPERAERALQKASYSELVEAVKRDPGNPRVFYYFGLRNRALGRLGPARAALAHSAELDPDSEDIALARAAVAGEAGNNLEAFDTLTALLKRHPESPNAHWAMALFYTTQRDWPHSYDEAIAVTQRRPNDVKAWRLAGTQALRVALAKRSEEAMRHAVALDPHDWRSQFGLGEALMSQHRNLEALRAYQAAVALAPNEPMVAARLGFAQQSTARTRGDLQQALHTLEHVVQQDPGNALAQLSLGETRIRLDDDGEAMGPLREAERLAPFFPETHYALLQLYRNLKEVSAEQRETRLFHEAQTYQTERDRLRRQLGPQTFTPSVCLKLARLCAAHGQNDEAGYQYQRLLGIPDYAPLARMELIRLAHNSPTSMASDRPMSLLSTAEMTTGDLPSLLRDADALVQKKQYPAAVDAYHAMLKQHPSSSLAWQGLGYAYREMGKDTEAFRSMNQALQLDPSLTQAQFILAAIYYDSGLYDEATRRLRRLLKQSPTRPEYFDALGDCLRDDPVTYAEAEDNYRRASQRDPSQPVYLVNMADMEMLNHKQVDAEKHYRQALQMAPTSPIAQMGLARCLLTGQATPTVQAEAEQLLRSVLVHDPHNEKASTYLGQYLVQRGDAKDAIPFLENAVLTSPNHKEPWYSLARAYDILHNRERSQYCYTAFRRVSTYADDLANTLGDSITRPQNATTRLKLARLYAQGGIYAKAINQYHIYLSLQPRDAQVRKELQDFTEHLKMTGKMPDMDYFNAMVMASVKAH